MCTHQLLSLDLYHLTAPRATGVLTFAFNPVLGGLSDALGRKPLMTMSPVFSCLTGSLLTWSPSVWALVVRRFFMPLSSTPWHQGESACLADMFAGNPGGYGLARSRINTVGAINKMICPMIGGALAAISIRLPWAVGAAAFMVQTVVMHLFLRETLPKTKRVPFKWKRSSNPLAFLTLFRRGRRVMLLAIAHMWSQAFAGRFATFRYEQLHLTQALEWGITERARYSSFRGVFEVPATVLSGRILKRFGAERALMLGQVTMVLEQLLAGCATTGLHFYLIRPLRLTADVAELAMQFTTTNIGASEGIPQGELQAAISSLSTIARIVTPILWGQVYAVGVAMGVPSLFYFVSAAGGVVQLCLLRVLFSMTRRAAAAEAEAEAEAEAVEAEAVEAAAAATDAEK
jgi:DHA1 family tetracycline resistance protein-like MFS transporter